MVNRIVEKDPAAKQVLQRDRLTRRSRSSRERYRGFVQNYKQRRLDDPAETGQDPSALESRRLGRGKHRGPQRASSSALGWKRREYLRDYLRWLWPHRYAVGAVFVLALLVTGLEMIEPLFMRFIIDRVLLNTELDSAARLPRLHLAGAVFVGVILLSNRVVLRQMESSVENCEELWR